MYFRGRRNPGDETLTGGGCRGSEVSLTHGTSAYIIINGARRVGVGACAGIRRDREGGKEREKARRISARGQRCVIALPIEFSYTGMASLMHKMTGPNSVIVRFTKRTRSRR